MNIFSYGKISFLNQKIRAFRSSEFSWAQVFHTKIAGPLLQRMDPFNLPGSIEPLNE